MVWRYWLIDLPAKIVDVWFRIYGYYFAALTMITVTIVMVLLLLALFGIRWGW